MSLARSGATDANDPGAETHPGGAPALSIRAATRTLDGRLVLDGVTLEIARGRIVVLAGPNGAGKTSLLRAIAGRLRLDAGTIEIEGCAPAIARAGGRLGLVPQDVALYPLLTVRENLTLLGRLAGVEGPTLVARVNQGLLWAGLADRKDALVRTLSGGMRRRVNLVAGILHMPAVLLLDEPTVGVDAASATRLHALLRRVKEAGMAVVLATHDLDEAAALADDLVVMAGGRVRAQGPVHELVSRVFASGGQLVVSVGTGDAEAAASVLSRDGFRQTGPHTWMRAADTGLAGLGDIGARLAAAGIHVQEVRLSEPSVRGAVAVLLGDDPPTADTGRSQA